MVMMMGLVISHAQSLFVSPLLFKCSKQYYFENTQNIIIWHSELRLNIRLCPVAKGENRS